MGQILNIGRANDNDIVMSEEYVSSHHAQLVVDDEGKVFINDLNSSNGTFVDGVRVNGSAELYSGAKVSLGGKDFPWMSYLPAGARVAPPAKSSKVKVYVLSLGITLVLLISAYAINEMTQAPEKEKDDTKIVNKDEHGAKGDSSSGKTASNTSGNHGGTNSGNNGNTGNAGNDGNAGNTGNAGGPTNSGTTVPSNISYDFSCMMSAEDNNISQPMSMFDSLRTNMIDMSGVTVSVQEEMDFATQNHESMLGGAEVLHNAESEHLISILNNLVAHIPHPRGFTYQLFLIQSDVLNAWTCGGRIYVTTQMLHFTKNDNEIAGIIGHELNHNELGHINKMLRAQKLSEQTFGPEFGSVAATIDAMIRSPFGKRDEMDCDFHGTDLCIASGYAPCDIVYLWDRMAADEGDYNSVDNFTRDHPYSANRRDCINNHLQVNYNISCY